MSDRIQYSLFNKIEGRKLYFLVIRFLQKQKVSKKIKLSYQLFLNHVVKKNYTTYKKYICLKTKRTKGIYAFLRLARSQIKEFFAARELLGFLKSSW